MLHNSPDTPHPWATAQLALNKLHTLQRTDAADGLQEAIMVKSVIDNKERSGEALWTGQDWTCKYLASIGKGPDCKGGVGIFSLQGR